MNLQQKLRETLFSVLPVMLIVMILGVTVAPLGGTTILRFLIGGILVIIGLTLFLLGVDIGILPIGERSGAALTSRRNLPLLLGASFFIGFMITIAEPDVQVLADQVRSIDPDVSKWGLILMIAGGIGFFVMLGILRTVLSIPLRIILIVSYGLIFAMAYFTPEEFQGVAFDSGGATTGPMTVPFIMALGVGVAAVRAKSSKDGSDSGADSFGLTGIASAGPIFAVCLYGIILAAAGSDGESIAAAESGAHEVEGLGIFITEFPLVLKEVSTALLPLVFMAALFQFTLIKMPPFQVIRMVRGLILSFVGLIVFLMGAKGGFMPAGTKLGEVLGSLAISGDKTLLLLNAAGEIEKSMLIPGIVQIILLLLTGCIFGAVVVCAEPAVWVLTDQVENVSGGTIKRKVMIVALSTGVAIAIGLSMARVLFRFSLWYVLIPGYIIALALTFFCPKLFTGIAFDSGGVASGPMTSTFILSFSLGASSASGGNPAVDAFGVIALVAMTPLIAIQILGIVFKIKTREAK
ncbi:DUF1538 domain-containing protein [Treponema rectale]|uniref:DUF1538 domain-containing protein n=1 Tax=Treponema rectale TaxID=744512 RepID=A0A840SHE5_9SPIR|nr:DUF1538 domain-containing protein [Treponema rectale]MBB5218943.1 hypothetical protein [Treponema rectale]QOS41145.1 DUF1538 domain-containing protein [Treponema rectale]